MRVNFIEQHIMFMEYGKRNKLSSHERMFYIALFYCANSLAMRNKTHEWPSDYFPVSNSDLNSLTGFDKRAISNLRNSLKQRGLIDFQKGNGKKSDPKYKIFYFTEIGCEFVPDRGTNGGENVPDTENGYKNAPVNSPTEYKNAPDTVPDSVPDTVPDDVLIGYENAPDIYTSLNNQTNNKINKNININKNNPFTSYPIMQEPEDISSEKMGIEGMDANIRFLVKKNIEYDALVLAYRSKKRMIDEIVDIITDVVLYKQDSLKVSGYEYPIEIARRKFLSLSQDHILYVLECFEANTTEIRNIRQYLIRTLINSTETIDTHYASMVQRDMPYLAAE